MGLARGRASRTRQPVRRLCRWLREAGVEFEDIAPAPRSSTNAWSAVELRPYQEAALSAWELAHRRGIVALPTGSGKTRLAIDAIRRTGLSALCLVPTRVLLDQWSREIATVYEGAVGRYGDGARQLAPVTVATFESAYRHMAQLGDRFDLVIVDEVHHFGAGLRDEALEMTTAGARLGLTATPPRDAAVLARLAELVGPTVFELAVADLAGGFLASFDAITLHLELSPEERSAYSGLYGLFSDRPPGVSAAWRRTRAGRTSPGTPSGAPRAGAPSRHGARCERSWRSRTPSVMPCDPCSTGTDRRGRWCSPPTTTRPTRSRASTW